jgi:alpha-glucosidase
MDTLSKIKGLYHIGLPTILATLNYGVRKWRYDAPARKLAADQQRQPVKRPGLAKKSEVKTHGLVVHFENADLEIRVLAVDLFRFTWTPGILPVPFTIEKRDYTGERCTVEEDENGWRCTTSDLSVAVSREGVIRVFDANGTLLREERPPQLKGAAWTHRALLREDEHVYGLGQRTGALNLRGGSYTLWNMEPMGDYGPGKDPIYVSIPLTLSMHANGCLLTYFENSHRSTVQLSDKALTQFEGGALRYYVVPGPPARALNRATELIGRPALPPKWALGYHQARWSYMNDAEVCEIVKGFKDRFLPLSVLHLDIHYMDGYRVFTVDPARFPDLKKLCDDLEREGVKVVTIMDPGVKVDPNYDVYSEGMSADIFCKLPNGQVVEGPVWPGRCAFPDFTKEAARIWWGGYYKRLTDLGVSGIWHDMNEPAVFTPGGVPTLPDSTRHDMDGRGGDHVEAHNLYALLENRAAYESLRKLRPSNRPWLLTRSGWAGIQRYAWNWTGDTGTNWWSLQQNLRLALMLGLSGAPYTGSDIGGFNGHPSPELYGRWFQMASFLTFFRTHSAVMVPRREPWTFGEPTTSIVRKFLELRYRLMPYWYTLAAEANKNGAPLVRPIWWTSPDERDLWDVDDQFCLGDAFLVAPILHQGWLRRKVVLPAGIWHDFWTGELVAGPLIVERESPLDHLPLMVRDGSVVPMQQGESLDLHVYLSPDAEEIKGRLYLDDGDGYGPNRWVTISGEREENGWSLVLKHTGEYPLPEGGLNMQIHGVDIKKTVADGKAVSIADNRLSCAWFDSLLLEK